MKGPLGIVDWDDILRKVARNVPDLAGEVIGYSVKHVISSVLVDRFKSRGWGRLLD